MAKSEIIRLRCTKEEKQQIQDEARKMGLSLSNYVLQTVLEDVRESTKLPIKSNDHQIHLTDGTSLSGKRTIRPDPKF